MITTNLDAAVAKATAVITTPERELCLRNEVVFNNAIHSHVPHVAAEVAQNAIEFLVMLRTHVHSQNHRHFLTLANGTGSKWFPALPVPQITVELLNSMEEVDADETIRLDDYLSMLQDTYPALQLDTMLGYRDETQEGAIRIGEIDVDGQSMHVIYLPSNANFTDLISSGKISI